jgi:hypothetical protein
MLPVPPTDEQAKAVQALAKTTGTALELTEKAGAYIGWVLGTVPTDLIGVLGGDFLAQVRIRNLARYKERTEEILRDRGVTPQPVSPSIAIPLFRAAYDESRPELQELWAQLIAAAMDPQRANRVRRSFIDTIQHLEPLDALILKTLYELPGTLSIIVSRLKVSADEIEISALNLDDVNCVNRVIRNTEPSFTLTLYGRELVRACSN